IGTGLFNNCRSLESFTFSASLVTIPDNMFYNCDELVSVYFSETSTLYSVGNLAFMYCENLANITLPDTVTTIGYNAFFQCNSLVEMYLPSSLIKIDNYGFYGCDLLTTIIYGDPYSLEYIGNYAFSWCPELNELFIADTVTYVGIRAFDNTRDVILNIEATSKPAGWAADWNANGALTVNWGVNHRTITVVLDNGESDILIYEKIGTVLTAPADPVKVGFDFTGWFTFDGVSYTPYSFTTMPEEDLTVYAQYTVTP
ncbi:MAG: leucine-rich repeat protein, partial [Candidatus Izemoplasmatales bacterium]|nr:leucine-rich repeat protein [Candidatus Izemoplasmatales bacterium]